MNYTAIHSSDLASFIPTDTLPPDILAQIKAVSKAVPFRVNRHILKLIDWTAVPDDPIYRLVFPNRSFLPDSQYQRLTELDDQDPNQEKKSLQSIYQDFNPNPGQQSENIPILQGQPLEGVQHKYQETVLIFPQPGQTCYAYCTYCFRWEQFSEKEPKFKLPPNDIQRLLAYLRIHPQVTDIVLTGGDPLFMSSNQLKKYLLPLLHPDFSHIKNIRIGSKAITYWPSRFLHDTDATTLLNLFENLVDAGKHVTLMANINHPREIKPAVTRQAIREIRCRNVEIRTQSPLLRDINDRIDILKDLWETEVELGCIPYYLFIPRNTGPRHCFEVPIHRAFRLFQKVYQNVSGLVKTIRGPVMSMKHGKIHVIGITNIGDQKRFVLEYIQAREPSLIRTPFFARFNPEATWFNDLEPAQESDRTFFNGEPLTCEPSLEDTGQSETTSPIQDNEATLR